MAKNKFELKVDQDDIFLELVFEVDDEKFTEAAATEINSFWMNEKRRVAACGGDVVKAALKLYAAECFALAAFNNFKDEQWVMDQFDWSKDKGIEGFPSFQEAGIVLKKIDNLQIGFDIIEFA
ncbi:DUF2528 family protein [Aeromonas hydrophila]|uniref:DUF2528 family protein n=1 Tax=Aeromonas hydrophila TaxID=644 RepID=UPI001FF43BF4|nr:DUF2528 family protein [Aeromonas hydrophila]MCK0187895.1 DUF2528 family protein [Aeromonas hydrophila]UOV94575.1 DUF2528 family protein [Aeromonas hydrophila]